MEIKKTPRANLEKEITLSYLMGVVIALAILFVGFEWGNTEVTVSTFSGTAVVIDEEEIEMTKQEEEVLPPPPPPEAPPVVDVLDIVDDTEEVADLNIASSEDNFDVAQTETYVAPVAAVIEKEEEDENFIYQNSEVRPEFPGGNAALIKFLNDNINYPTIASENGVSGTVNVEFTVNIDGSVTDVVAYIKKDPSLDREAIRVVKLLPRFKPGENNGKPVRVKYQVPVKFTLRNQ